MEVVVGFFIIWIYWVYTSVCFQLIAKKLNERNSWLVWIPLVREAYILKLAQESGWWVIVWVPSLIIPIIFHVISIIVLRKVAIRLDKNDTSRFMLVIPFVNFIYIGIMAFRQEPVYIQAASNEIFVDNTIHSSPPRLPNSPATPIFAAHSRVVDSDSENLKYAPRLQLKPNTPIKNELPVSIDNNQVKRDIFCIKCGQKMPPEAKFCGGCGAKIIS